MVGCGSDNIDCWQIGAVFGKHFGPLVVQDVHEINDLFLHGCSVALPWSPVFENYVSPVADFDASLFYFFKKEWDRLE